MPVNDEHYGQLQDGVEHGNIVVNISGGVIGNNYEYVYNPSDEVKHTTMPNTEFNAQNRLTRTKGGNVTGNTQVNITGGEVKNNVYGGGNAAAVTGNTNVVIGQERVTP